jgi:hypothetical protein
MAQTEIKEIPGVWSEIQVESLKTWLQSPTGISEINTIKEKAYVDSKVIDKMTLVDVNELKTPFTFSL